MIHKIKPPSPRLDSDDGVVREATEILGALTCFAKQIIALRARAENLASVNSALADAVRAHGNLTTMEVRRVWRK